MKGVQEILEHLGYGEIRLESAVPGAPDWRPIDAAALFAAVLCWGALQAGAAAREAVWSLRRFEGR